MRHIEEIRYNYRLDIVPPIAPRGRTFSENRIQGHSSGRAGGLSHQGLNRGSGMNEPHSPMDHNKTITNSTLTIIGNIE